MAVGIRPTNALGGHATQPPPQLTRPELGLDLSVLFERALEAVVVAQLATGRIVLWNPAAQALFGYAADEVVGQSIERLMSAPIAQVHRAGLERYLRTGHGLIVDANGPVEMPAVTKSGEEIRVELSLSELSNAAGERFALAVIRDASQRKALELINLELVQARVARSEAEAELGGRDELLDTLTTSLRANPTADDLRQLVNTLTEFRRLHGGQLQVRVLPRDLVDLVHAAADAMRRRSIGRRLLIDTPPHAWVNCDPTRMRDVIDQVLDEAIRRTSGRARIEVRLEMVSRHLAQLTIRSEACGDTRPAGASLQLCRTLLQRQGGTFATSISPGGSLEVIMTLPGSPRPVRRTARRTRKAEGTAG